MGEMFDEDIVKLGVGGWKLNPKDRKVSICWTVGLLECWIVLIVRKFPT